MIFTLIIVVGSVSAAFGDTSSAGKSFSDIKASNWAYESVNAMSQKGILAGYPDGTFKQSNTVTYGQFIKMALIGATKEDIGNSSTGNWAEGYYNKALELQYFSQASIDKSKLNNNIPRGDMALIISNILGDTKIENYDKLEQGISDVNSTTKNDYDIIKAYESGILTGYEDGTFKPNGTLTRAEAVTVIHRLVDESKRVLPSQNTTAEVKTNVSEVIQNKDTLLDDSNQVDKYLTNVTCYRIIKDATPYNFKLTQRFDVTAINSTYATNMYLMKDNKIAETLAGGSKPDKTMSYIYHVDITQMDYIVCVPFDADEAKAGDTVEALLIINPFKK